MQHNTFDCLLLALVELVFTAMKKQSLCQAKPELTVWVRVQVESPY